MSSIELNKDKYCKEKKKNVVLIASAVVSIDVNAEKTMYEGWNFNSGNYLFTTDTKWVHVSKFYCPSM